MQGINGTLIFETSTRGHTNQIIVIIVIVIIIVIIIIIIVVVVVIVSNVRSSNFEFWEISVFSLFYFYPFMYSLEFLHNIVIHLGY